jgi:hypothetical protein
MFHLCIMADNPPLTTSAHAILMRMLYEQIFGSSFSHYEYCRSHIIFNGPDRHGHIIDWESIIGMPLDDYIRGCLILACWALNNAGQIKPQILDQPNMTEVYNKVLGRHELTICLQSLTATQEEFQERWQSSIPDPTSTSSTQRYSFNPLTVYPIVNLRQHGLWVPHPMAVIQAPTYENLWHAGVRKLGQPFADRLGARFEDYVGAQLKYVFGDENVNGEFTIRSAHHGQGKTVDWLITGQECVILVECKAAHVRLGTRMGHDTVIAKDFNRTIGKAKQQIEATVNAIRRGKLPDTINFATQPIIGLIVTAEPFALAGSPLGPINFSEGTPTVVLSISDLERLAGGGTELLTNYVKEAAAFNQASLASDTPAPTIPRKIAPNRIIEQAELELFPNLHSSRDSL